MNKLFKFFSLLMILLLMVSVSCKDEDPLPADNDFLVLSEYMMDNDLDLPNVLSGWITVAPTDVNDVPAFITDNYVIDIRAANDFASGHIENAVNGSLGTILTDAANAGGKPIVVVCYTGQSAGHAVMALRLMGYSNAKVLKFGMSGWHSTYDSWSNNTGDAAVGHSNWVTTATETPTTFANPTWEATATTGQTILQERVEAMLAKGFQRIGNDVVLPSPDDYFINNYWAQTDTDQYGHIASAYRIHPMSLANGDFEKLDPTETIVSYCWTGQTSSMLTAYLTVLGFEAKSLKFGVNAMIYSQLQGHKFVLPSVDLPVVIE